MVILLEENLNSLKAKIGKLNGHDEFEEVLRFSAHFDDLLKYFYQKFLRHYRQICFNCPETQSKWINFKQDWDFQAWKEKFGLIILELLTNAIRHGNKHDPQNPNFKESKWIPKKIKITTYFGQNGTIYSIKDEGLGFRVNAIADKVSIREKEFYETHDQETKYVNINHVNEDTIYHHEASWGIGFATIHSFKGTITTFNFKGRKPPNNERDRKKQKYGSEALICYLFKEKDYFN